MEGMDLVFVLRLLVREHNVQTDLVRLLDHRSRARDHPADVELERTRNRLQILLDTGDQFVNGLRVGRIGPENDDVVETGGNYRYRLHM